MIASNCLKNDILDPGTPELLTTDDVARIVAQRLHWYGLGHFAIKSVQRREDRRIKAEIVDLAADQSYIRLFDIYPLLGDSSGSDTAIRRGRPTIAA